MAACCCGALEGDCPCHSANGGPSSYSASWTGSITATVPTCACMLSLAGPPPGGAATYADRICSNQTWSGSAVTVTWQSANPTDPCILFGSTAKTAACAQEVQLYNGGCTDTANTFNLNVTLSYAIQAPDPANGIGYWEATVSLSGGILQIKFRSNSQSCSPVDWYHHATTVEPDNGGGCGYHYLMADWSYSVGSFTLT